MERNMAFKANSRRELAEAEAAALLPLKEQLNKVLAKVAAENGLIMIVNTDGDACPYITPSLSVDAMPMVMEELKN
jgi:outer membrane protein